MKRVRRYPIASSSGPWSKATTTVAPIAVSHQNAKASAARRRPTRRSRPAAGPAGTAHAGARRRRCGRRPHAHVRTRVAARRNTTARPLRRRSAPSTRSAVPSACATARRPHPTSAAHRLPVEIAEQAQQQRGVLLLFRHEKLCRPIYSGSPARAALRSSCSPSPLSPSWNRADRFDQRAAHRVGDIAAVVECDGRVGLGVHVLVLLEMLDPRAECADRCDWPVASWSPG